MWVQTPPYLSVFAQGFESQKSFSDASEHQAFLETCEKYLHLYRISFQIQQQALFSSVAQKEKKKKKTLLHASKTDINDNSNSISGTSEFEEDFEFSDKLL